MAEFRLTPGNDFFVGTSATDVFVDLAPGGSDNLQGEGGTDRFYAEVSNAHIVIDLGFDSGAQLALSADPETWEPGDPGLSRYNFIEIENLDIVNFDGRTILRGDSNDNFLGAEFGNAVLEGGAGNDRLFAAGGDSTFNGGDGNDSIEAYFNNRSGFSVVHGGPGSDELQVGIQMASLTATAEQGGVLLTSGDNQLLVHDDVEIISLGATGPMTYAELEALTRPPIPEIIGTDGREQLQGSDATEIIRGLGGADVIIGSRGDDTLDGGASNGDYVTYLYDGGPSVIRARDVDLTTDPYRMEYRVDGDVQVLFGIEGLTGTRGPDVFRGTIGPDLQVGRAGSDTFYASPGADRYLGDGYFGNEDNRDTLRIASTEDGSVTQLSLLSGKGFSGLAAGDRYRDIEWVFGYGTSPFDIVGDHGSNFLGGGAGDDTLTGFAGNDVIDGGAGADVAVFDYVYQEARIEDRGPESGFPLDPALNGKLVSYIGPGSTDGQDKTANIETLQFLNGSYDVATETFTETGLLINGTIGADRLVGTQYLDLMWGFAGNDVMVASAGPDKVNGGAGRDRLLVGTDGADVHLSLLAGRGWAGEAEGDRLIDIEDVVSFGGNDTIAGDHGDNRLISGAGDDVVAGLAGNDIIDTGFGFDRVVFGFNRDQYQITARDGSTAQDGISWQVRYIGNGTGDGTNIVTHAEVLQFADGDFIL